MKSGETARAYEITVKAFGEDRVRDSYESVKALDLKEGEKSSEITILCRKEDSHPEVAAGVEEAGYLGKLAHRDLTYHFIEIHAWLLSQILRMTPTARLSFHEKLDKYVGDFNTSETVKQLWSELHTPPSE